MKNLTEFESRKLLKKYGFSLPKAKLAKDAFSAAAFAGKIGYPVVLKIMSPDILHKSDFGCVKTGIGSPSEVHVSFSNIIKNALAHNPGAKIDGILVEETLRGTEVIIGAKQDPQFGPIVLFGLGGVFVEILKDAAIRLAPIQRADAEEMISEIKGKKLLEGYRGAKPINLKAIEDALLKASKLIVEHPQIKEMDINPLFAGEKRAAVGDARIILK
ncbi:Acetate--CoA ligase [ADP-forming] I subunit beta [uncultured archaeon]|nr:Acetate--CoA ligase [ADP-forming] I subunit beta [uncultured archaeon]